MNKDNDKNEDKDSQTTLYYNNDPVVILKDDDLEFSNYVTIKNPKGAGILKAYASWCGYCQNKVPDIKTLGATMKQHGLCVYVINAAEAPNFSDSKNVQAYPTFYAVDVNGVIGDVLQDSAGNNASNIPDVIGALCDHHDDFCRAAGLKK